jgi:uncharacterized protein
MASTKKAKAKAKKESWLSKEALAAMESIRVYMANEFCIKPDGEELHPELQEFCERGDFPTIRHPLLYAVPYFKQSNGLYNRQFALRKLMVRDLMAAGRIESVLTHVERPYRIQKLMELRDKLTQPQFWRALRWVWTDSENLWQSVDLLHDILKGKVDRKNMMDACERAFLAKLGGEIRVYRGHAANNREGWSWTMSASKACWFARRYADRGTKFAKFMTESVATGFVRNRDVVAYLSGRGEYEIIVDPEKVRDLRAWPGTGFGLGGSGMGLTKAQARLGQLATDRFKLSAGKSDHGPAHWINVLRIGRNLVHQYLIYNAGIDLAVVEAFALLHDCCRENEMDDADHGRRAAREAPALLQKAGVKMGMTQLGKLQAAIAGHADGRTTDDPTIGACWDADRLDLIRVGIVPQKRFLSTTAAKFALGAAI